MFTDVYCWLYHCVAKYVVVTLINLKLDDVFSFALECYVCVLASIECRNSRKKNLAVRLFCFSVQSYSSKSLLY